MQRVIERATNQDLLAPADMILAEATTSATRLLETAGSTPQTQSFIKRMKAIDASTFETQDARRRLVERTTTRYQGNELTPDQAAPTTHQRHAFTPAKRSLFESDEEQHLFVNAKSGEDLVTQSVCPDGYPKKSIAHKNAPPAHDDTISVVEKITKPSKDIIQ